MYTDPIADLLTRIRNATMARKETTEVPFSSTKANILETLKKRGFIRDFKVQGESIEKAIIITLSPERNRISLKRISKPGQRIYVKAQDIKKVNGGLGLAVISTPKGILSGEEATKLRVGGELICEVF